MVTAGNVSERLRHYWCSFIFLLCSLPHWPSELPSESRPLGGRLGCAREALFMGTISQRCWNSSLFSCGSCVDHFCFICKIERVTGEEGEREELVQSMFNLEDKNTSLPLECALVFHLYHLSHDLTLRNGNTSNKRSSKLAEDFLFMTSSPNFFICAIQ